MQLKYDVTRQDLIAFNEHFTLTSGVINFRRVAAVQAVIMGISAFFLMMIAVNNVPSSGVVGAVLGLVVYLAWPSVHRAQVKRSIQKIVAKLHAENAGDGLLGAHSLEFESDGLVERTAVNEMHQTWAGIPRVDITAMHVFIFVTPTTAFLIPRAAIDDFPAFLKAVAQHAGREKIRRFDDVAA